MKSKSLFKFIYKEILPFAIGFITMTALQISYPELRKQYGRDYCVKCPDSYTCPTGLSGMG